MKAIARDLLSQPDQEEVAAIARAGGGAAGMLGCAHKTREGNIHK